MIKNKKNSSILKKITLLYCFSGITAAFASGYYTQSNVQSFSAKNVSDNTLFNDQTLTLESITTKNTAQGLPYGVGHVVNTQFANTGYAGCGVSYPLMQQIYKSAPSGKDYSGNYLALNVFSHLMGYDSNAPLWSSTSGEGSVAGYVNFLSGQLGYPYRQYLRSMPALYPAYLGMYDNGKSCGRFVQVDTSNSQCADSSGTPVGGASKACTTSPANSYQGTSFYGYIFDSCEDNNGWCRDDDAHLDMNSAITGANNYISWKFTQNPYYTDQTVPSQLKDVWLAWYSNPVNAYWTYLEVANLPNGLGMLQINIGSSTNPIWVNSHYQAGGSSNMTWTEGTSNGQTWQLQPMNSYSDSAPPADAMYQIRLFDLNGYPVKNGQIYQFDLQNTLKAATQPVSGEMLFYKGQPGTGSSIITAPDDGTATLQVSVSDLPGSVPLSAFQPVLIDSNGFSYDPVSCNSNSCSFSKLPSGTTFKFYGVYQNELSNDLVVRTGQHLIVNESGITLTGNSNAVSFDASDWDFTTTYTAAVTVPVSFSVSKPTGQSVNANLQALFIPTNSTQVSANTQGCFLNNYYSKTSTTTSTTCYLYYTAHQKGSFNSSIPSIQFTMQLPQDVGVDSANDMQLQSNSSTPVTITGYNSSNNILVVPQTVSTVTYKPSTGNMRSLYLMLDADSDAQCLTGLQSVGVSIGSASATLTSADADKPVLVSIPFGNQAMTVNATLTMQANAPACTVNLGEPSVKPGSDIVEMVKLSALPTSSQTVQNQGVDVAATANNSICYNQHDVLNFGNTKVDYTVSSSSTRINLPTGSYTVTSQGVSVAGGTCQLTPTSVSVSAGQYAPLSLNYTLTSSGGGGGAALSCTAKANVSTAPGWDGCNVTFDVTNTSGAVIPQNAPLNLSWSGNTTGMQPWNGVTLTNSNGQVVAQLPVYNDIAVNAIVLGSTQGWGMNIDGSANCSALATVPITCEAN